MAELENEMNRTKPQFELDPSFLNSINSNSRANAQPGGIELAVTLETELPNMNATMSNHENKAGHRLESKDGNYLENKPGNHDENKEFLLADRQPTIQTATPDEWSISRVLRSKELLLPLALACSVNLAQQITGINAVFFYSAQIFTQCSIKEEYIQWPILGTGLINVLSTFLAVRFTA